MLDFEKPINPEEGPEKSVPDAFDENAQSSREKLEEAFGRPIQEIYHESVIEGRKNLEAELAAANKDIEISRGLEEMLKKWKAGEQFSPQWEDLFKTLDEAGEAERVSVAAILEEKRQQKEQELREYE